MTKVIIALNKDRNLSSKAAAYRYPTIDLPHQKYAETISKLQEEYNLMLSKKNRLKKGDLLKEESEEQYNKAMAYLGKAILILKYMK